MNLKIVNKKIVIVFSFYIIFVKTVAISYVLDAEEYDQWPNREENKQNGDPEDRKLVNMTGEWRNTVKVFYCSVPSSRMGEEPELLIYGTKSWKFPKQNVTLTLGYPLGDKRVEHLITGFKVVIYLDGTECYGYVTSGGILQESIHVEFFLKNISLLSYQFWVYGLVESPDIHDLKEAYSTSYYNMCPNE